MSDTSWVVTIDDGTVKRSFKMIENHSVQTGKTIGKNLSEPAENSFDKLKKALLKIGSAVAVGAFFKKAIDSSREMEASTNQLSAALATQGAYSREAVSSFLSFADSMETMTGVQDDVIIKNAALLASLGRLSGQGLQNATKAALNFAAGAQMEVGSAFNLVAKAAEGNVSALGRYGIRVSDVGSKSEVFARALAAIEAKFGGMAGANLKTFDGALLSVSNGFDNMMKTIGKFITDSPVVREALKFLGDTFRNIGKYLEQTFGNKDLIGNFILKIIDVTKSLMPAVKAFEILFNVIKTGFLTARVSADTFIAAFATVIGWVGDAMKKLGVSNAFTEFTDTFRESTRAALSDAYDSMSQSANAVLDTSFSSVIEQGLDRVQQKTAAVAKGTLLAAQEFKNGTDSMKASAFSVGDAFSGVMAGMKSAALEFAEQATQNFQQIGKTMFQSLGNAAGQAFAAFGKAIHKGENALEAFVNSLLASMGQMAVQLGTQFILQGLAYMWAGMPNGPSLVAAGAALAAFGGILSSMGGGGAESGGASAGGGVASEPDVAGPSPIQNNEVNTEPGTNVVVNIQGDVLDSDDSGMRIVDLINTAFDKKGVTIQRGAVT